jgi:O-antigen/teichoic acid export membrane protein
MSLRRTAARGTMINGAYLVALNSLGIVKGLLAATLLTVGQYGIWGILSLTLLAALWLKEMGVADKFVQQREPDQEAAFQHAFSVELLVTTGVFVLTVAAMPILGLVYGHGDIVAPGIALALILLALPFQAPIWLHYRELRFASQRGLQAIDPVVSFVLTVVLASVGLGYWSLVVGSVTGSWIAALVCVRCAPYRLRWRLDRRVLRSYIGFSWPLFIGSLSGLAIGQATLIVGEAKLGLVAAAGIALATTVSRYAQRLQDVLTQTMFPVVARVRNRPDLLEESFIKSNRLGLIWAGPFGIGFALFVDDLIRLSLGREWAGALLLLQVTGVVAVVKQVGYNWSAYYRAHGDTRPIMKASLLSLAAFAVVALPLLLARGLDGYASGVAAMAAVDFGVRRHYLKRIFPRLSLGAHAVRALAPLVPATVAVVALRAFAWTGERTASMVAVEAAVFVAGVVAATVVLERALLGEVFGYLRMRSRTAPVAGPSEATA